MFRDIGKMLGKFADDAVGPPDENPRVPEKFATFHEGLGDFKRWLFGKKPHLVEITFCRNGIVLDVTVTSVGACWLDAHRAQDLVAGSEGHGFFDAFVKSGFIENQVIARCHHEHGIRIQRSDMVGSQRNAGRGIFG